MNDKIFAKAARTPITTIAARAATPLATPYLLAISLIMATGAMSLAWILPTLYS